MPAWSEKVTRLITIRYYTALGLIALFATASFLILNRSVELQRDRFEIAETAAKQRMSSQRIGFLANALVNATDDEERQQYRNALRRAIDDMARRHDILALKAPSSYMTEGMRSILRDVYHGGLNPFSPQVGWFLDSARTVLDLPDGDLHSTSPSLIKLNVGVERILQTHRLVAKLLRMEAIKAVHRIQVLDALLWILTLALLAILVPLIFRPMAKRAAKTLARMEGARQTAEREAAIAKSAREGQASFIRTMSHELRTPLNAILGMAQLLRMNGLPDKQAEYAKDIHQAGESLLELINDILEFSRLEARQVMIEKAQTSLEDELARIISMFHSLAEEKSLDLTCEVDPALAKYYWADGLRIRQIMINLVGNALKFTTKGFICVRAEHAGSAESVGDLVRFEVKDSGIGVPRDLQELIFEEFQQADNSLARKYGGSGLGLAISSRLVHLMGGEMGIESQEGRGSTFWFILPLERMTGPGLQRPVAMADELRQAG